MISGQKIWDSTARCLKNRNNEKSYKKDSYPDIVLCDFGDNIHNNGRCNE